jgi:hypothetical protein
MMRTEQLDGKIVASARDESPRFAAESEGWLLQANHLLHNGMSTEQYLELEGAIGVVERERGGSTMTAGYGNLPEVRAAQQRARNNRLIGELATTTAAGDGVSGGNSERRARCSDDDVEVVIASVNWPFGTPERTKKMVSRVRSRSMMRMGDRPSTRVIARRRAW